MATALVNDKIMGGMGIAAVIVFIASMFIAAFTKSDFTFGNGTLGDLTSETIFVIGCVIAGILGVLFGLLVTVKETESSVFIGKVRGILIMLSGAALVAIGLTNGNDWVVYLFIALISLTAVSDIFYNWVVDQKMLMLLSLLLTLFIVLTGILSKTGDNYITGFAFALFVSAWVLFVAIMRFAPIVEAEPKKTKGENRSKAGKETKKNSPAPRPYPAKKEEAPAPKKTSAEKTVYREEIKKAEPKKYDGPLKSGDRAEETGRVEPKKEEPKKAEPRPEAKEELPKLKVMSSREAAAARDSARKKDETEPETRIAAEPETTSEPVTHIAAETEETKEAETADEDYEEDFGIVEDTPDSLLRRATWNKGLRCRRNYGEYQIPTAFVKAKVAVYVLPEAGDTSVDEKLRAEGWTVFRYLESEITDGKEQAEEISKAVKESLREQREAKKKKARK